VNSVDDLAHDAFVVSGQIDAPLPQYLDDVATGLRTRLVGELLGVLARRPSTETCLAITLTCRRRSATRIRVELITA
jgi:hypothetical protein